MFIDPRMQTRARSVTRGVYGRGQRGADRRRGFVRTCRVRPARRALARVATPSRAPAASPSSKGSRFDTERPPQDLATDLFFAPVRMAIPNARLDNPAGRFEELEAVGHTLSAGH